MRKLEDIEKDLAAARTTLAEVEGRPTEVYSRIVGYYRSVQNWNRGKREEYGQRRLYKLKGATSTAGPQGIPNPQPARTFQTRTSPSSGNRRLLLFVRPACPSCPTAKDAAGRLGIPVDLVDADTEAGLAEAVRRNVLSTPTAILLSADGVELARAPDARSIAAFAGYVAPDAAAM